MRSPMPISHSLSSYSKLLVAFVAAGSSSPACAATVLDWWFDCCCMCVRSGCFWSLRWVCWAWWWWWWCDCPDLDWWWRWWWWWWWWSLPVRSCCCCFLWLVAEPLLLLEPPTHGDDPLRFTFGRRPPSGVVAMPLETFPRGPPAWSTIVPLLFPLIASSTNHHLRSSDPDLHPRDAPRPSHTSLPIFDLHSFQPLATIPPPRFCYFSPTPRLSSLQPTEHHF